MKFEIYSFVSPCLGGTILTLIFIIKIPLPSTWIPADAGMTKSGGMTK
ncbi:MAG TPA: hypothetical protein PLX80_04380 [Ignavibacteria bacterium]|nr:hypothetical protein [Ignavibacteria bacterium]